MPAITRRETFTTLTAPGNTSTQKKIESTVGGVFAFTLAAVNTNVVVGLLGSCDGGTTYARIPISSASTTISSNTATVTSNGTYFLHFTGFYDSVAFEFISEAGGTAATLAVKALVQ